MTPKFVLLLIVAVAATSYGKSCHDHDADSGATTTTTNPTTTTPTATCPAGEIVDTCSVDCPSDYCANSEADSLTSCSPPILCPTEATCKCSFNDRRSAPGGPCISVYDCPAFDCSARPNEVYNPCQPLCPTDDCLYAPFNGTCPPLFGNIGIVLMCTPRCTCAEGYWRNNGVCVPRAECPSIIAQTTTA